MSLRLHVSCTLFASTELMLCRHFDIKTKNELKSIFLEQLTKLMMTK